MWGRCRNPRSVRECNPRLTKEATVSEKMTTNLGSGAYESKRYSSGSSLANCESRWAHGGQQLPRKPPRIGHSSSDDGRRPSLQRRPILFATDGERILICTSSIAVSRSVQPLGSMPIKWLMRPKGPENSLLMLQTMHSARHPSESRMDQEYVLRD